MKKTLIVIIVVIAFVLTISSVWIIYFWNKTSKSNLYINSMCGFSLMYPDNWHPVDGWGDNISFISDDNSGGIFFEKINLNQNWDFNPSEDGLRIWAKWNIAKSETYKREIQGTNFNGNEFYYGVFDISEYKNDPDTIAGFRNEQCGFIIAGYSGNLESHDFQKLFEDFLRSMVFDDALIHK